MEEDKRTNEKDEFGIFFFFHYSACAECLGKPGYCILSTTAFISSTNFNGGKNSLSSAIALIS